MILHKGNMFDMWGYTDLFLFTSNPVASKTTGKAVMGRGIAREVADRCPLARDVFGKVLLAPRPANVGILGYFGDEHERDQLLGWFRVKDHFAQDARLNIIESSVETLSAIAPGFERIDLNFPGIGNGNLAREDVLPVISTLPDNVYIWEYDNEN